MCSNYRTKCFLMWCFTVDFTPTTKNSGCFHGGCCLLISMETQISIFTIHTLFTNQDQYRVKYQNHSDFSVIIPTQYSIHTHGSCHTAQSLRLPRSSLINIPKSAVIFPCILINVSYGQSGAKTLTLKLAICTLSQYTDNLIDRSKSVVYLHIVLRHTELCHHHGIIQVYSCHTLNLSQDHPVVNDL